MKRIFLILISIFALLFIPASASAQDTDSETKDVVLSQDEVVDSDYIKTGDTITLSGVVNGDAYLFAGSIIVEGKVTGDLIAAGGQIVVRGEVGNNVRVFGGDVTISDKVGRNLTFVGGNIEITDSAKINGSVVGAGGNVSIFAPVGKGAKFGVGNLTLGSSIGGDVEAGVGILTLTSEAKVVGDLKYWSDTEANLHSGAKVTGELTKNTPPQEFDFSPTKFLGVMSGINLFFQFIAFISSLIVGLLLIRFLPNSSEKFVNLLNKRPWASAGIGILTLILTPIVIILLLLLVVTIPIALILLAVYLISLYLTRIFVSYFIGKKVLAKFVRKNHNNWALLIGLVAFGIISLIPIIGGIFVFLSLLFGLGAIFLKLKDQYTSAREKNVI